AVRCRRRGGPGKPSYLTPAQERQVVAAGARESLGTRWVVADGGYSSRTFVEGVRELDLHAAGRLRRDSVLRFPYTGAHERRPGRRRPFDGCFDRRDPARMARTTLDDEAVDLYPRGPARQDLAVLTAGGVRPAPQGRPADEGGRAAVQQRPGPGAGTPLPDLRCPFPD
ncbi:MAG: transposase, partial [Caldilineaceae bacterium]|nr:transposase [Caldilineaceae bacterium]